MIEERNYPLFIALVHEFADKISARGRMRSVEFAKTAGIVQRKSVVVASGERNILASRVFCGLQDF